MALGWASGQNRSRRSQLAFIKEIERLMGYTPTVK